MHFRSVLFDSYTRLEQFLTQMVIFDDKMWNAIKGVRAIFVSGQIDKKKYYCHINQLIPIFAL